jgi:hypothetical protein
MPFKPFGVLVGIPTPRDDVRAAFSGATSLVGRRSVTAIKNSRRSRGGCLLSLLLFGCEIFALDVTGAPFSFQLFIVLLAHSSLL